MKKELFLALRNRVESLLTRNKDHLPSEAVNAVHRYINHDEIEIALEGLCLELLEQGMMTGDMLEECIELGKKLHLDEESVLNDDFWALMVDQQQD